MAVEIGPECHKREIIEIIVVELHITLDYATLEASITKLGHTMGLSMLACSDRSVCLAKRCKIGL